MKWKLYIRLIFKTKQKTCSCFGSNLKPTLLIDADSQAEGASDGEVEGVILHFENEEMY